MFSPPSFVSSSLTFVLAPAPQAHEPQLIDVDGTIFVQLAVFLLLVALLYRFLWKPYLRVREVRVTRVEGYREEAARLQAEADARMARLEADLAEARRIGSGERTVARVEAQAREQTLMAEAQAAAQKMLANARAELEATVAGERAKLQQKAAELGRDAAKKILGREV